MAVRIQGKFESERGRIYNLEIWDTQYSDAPVEVDIGGEGFLLTYDPEEERPDAALIPSSLEFTIVQKPSNKTELTQFVNDFIGSEEGRFQVKVIRESGLGALHWVGFALPDQLVFLDTRWADSTIDLKITAKDGLNRLKDIPYNDNGAPYSGRETFKNHLFNCLEKLGTDAFYAPDSVYLTAMVRWYEDQDTTADEFTNEMDRTYVDHLAFISYNDNSQEEYTSTWDVLQTIVTLWGARLYMAEGIWRLDQWNEYQITSGAKRHVYLKNRTKSGTESGITLDFREDEDKFITASEGLFGTLPAVKGVEITHESRDDRNYVQAHQIWDQDKAEIQIQLPAKGMRYLIKGMIKSRVLFADPASPYIDLVEAHIPVHAEIGMQLSTVGALNPISFSRPVLHMNNGAYTYDQATWDGGLGTILMPLQVYPQYVYLPFVLDTPTIPDTSNELETFRFDFDFIRSLDGDGQVPGPPNEPVLEEFEITDLSLQVLDADGNPVTKRRTVSAGYSSSSGAGEIIKKTVLVADTGDNFLGSTGVSILVDGSHQHTADWKKGRPSTDDPNLIQRLLAIEIFKRHNKPLKVFDATLYCYENIRYGDAFTLTTGEQFVAMQATYDSFLDAWIGQFALTGHTDVLPGGTVLGEVPEPGDPPGFVVPNNNGGQTTGTGAIAPIGGSFPNGGHIVSTTGAASYNDGDVITSIEIEATGVDGLIQAGNTVAVIDRSTGIEQTFTVTSNVGATDTTISVSSATIDGNFGSASFVTLSTSEYISNLRQGTFTRFVQKFSNPASSTLTITENGGTLPSDNNNVDVIYNGQVLVETDDYTISGNDVVLTFSPKGNVIVKFLIFS